MSRIIRIPVHGFVELRGVEERVLDSPEVQRLRRVRQLGLAELVYPGATHTRLEHSLGVKYLCDRVMEIHWEELKRNVPDVGKFSRSYIEEVLGLAGLLHDVGHPPFSHVPEPLLEEELGADHEDIGRAVARVVLERADAMDVEVTLEVAFGPGDGWTGALHSVIAGNLGVDRLDYLMRDSLHASVEYGRIELDRLLHTLELGDPVVVHEKGLEAAESVLISRYHMYRAVYFHKTCRAGDAMLLWAMHVAAEDGDLDLRVFDPDKLSRSEDALSAFRSMDDSTLLNVLEEHPESREFVDALKNRRLYKCVAEYQAAVEPKHGELFEVAVETSEEHLGEPFGVLLDSSKVIPYDPSSDEVIVRTRDGDVPLSEVSDIVATLKERTLSEIPTVRVYVHPGARDDESRVRRIVEHVKSALPPA
ncbi:HD domain-containing protein [Methanopyrus sp.]